ncbi:MAG: endonuclease domain-containing protein [Chloroflexi bacterium]|nr:endonuclease domain-containing protein [Chloroflexota bacterium]
MPASQPAPQIPHGDSSAADPNPEARLFHSPPELWNKLKSIAREMRHEPTPAEEYLWQRLRNRQVAGAKFRRQYAIDHFIVDFVCLEQRLIIEVDGSIHNVVVEYDAHRQAVLEAQGFRFLRFRNEDVLESIDDVIAAVTSAIGNFWQRTRPIKLNCSTGRVL